MTGRHVSFCLDGLAGRVSIPEELLPQGDDEGKWEAARQARRWAAPTRKSVTSVDFCLLLFFFCQTASLNIAKAVRDGVAESGLKRLAGFTLHGLQDETK